MFIGLQKYVPQNRTVNTDKVIYDEKCYGLSIH